MRGHARLMTAVHGLKCSNPFFVPERKLMKARLWWVVASVVVVSGSVHGEHRPLVPGPQQVEYGTGSVALREMEIEYAAPPDAEDQFAAGELQKGLREETGQKVSIAAYGNAVRAALPVMLEREGSSDVALAQPGEQPGPASREAYELTVTEQGVKIHARSSAG